MPNKCCVPGCKGNYTADKRVAVFSFPSDSNLRKKWVAAIPQKNLVPTKYTKVCEIHFRKTDILWFTGVRDSRTGEIITADLAHPRLKADAVPCRFPRGPSSLSRFVKHRDSRDDKLKLFEKYQLQSVIKLPQSDYETPKKLLSYKTYCEFLKVFSSLKLPDGWFTVKDADTDNTVIFRLQYNPVPVVTYSVIITSELVVQTFLFNEEVNISDGQISTPFITNSITEIECLLQKIDPIRTHNKAEDTKNSCSSNQLLLGHISKLLDSVLDEEDSLLSFVNEQIKLYVTSKEQYRYSANIILIASILYTVSPRAYKFLRSSGAVILPSPVIISGVCSKFLTNPVVEDKKNFLRYAKMIYKYSNINDKYVILLIDKIHIQPFMDFKGGNTVGNAFNNTDLTNSAYVFMINSVKSSFREVIHIAPLSHINHSFLHILIQMLIIGLEEIGFNIFCVISDDNDINCKAMSNFSEDKVLRIVYPHPSDNTRPLFYMINPVHILKCTRNNWINSKPEQILTYPDFNNDTTIIRKASVQAIKELNELERYNLLKFGYSLDVKALFPSNLEKENVKVALKIFNPYLIEGLKLFGKNITHAEDTADFVSVILRWWNIVNVKTPLNGKPLRDPFQEPVVSGKCDDPKLVHLRQILKWLDAWKDEKYSNKLTIPTHTALSNSVYCMLEILNYCFEELHMKYVLLGKFQIDPLEDRFANINN